MSDDETPKKKLSAKERIARRKKKKGNKKLISSPSSDDNDKNNGKPPGEEEFNEDVYRGKLREISNLQGLFHNKSLHGFPINCPFTDMKSILAKVRDTNIHHNEAKDVKFACAVKVFPYPNEIFSVWVFLLSECEKQNTV